MNIFVDLLVVVVFVFEFLCPFFVLLLGGCLSSSSCCCCGGDDGGLTLLP